MKVNEMDPEETTEQRTSTSFVNIINIIVAEQQIYRLPKILPSRLKRANEERKNDDKVIHSVEFPDLFSEVPVTISDF